MIVQFQDYKVDFKIFLSSSRSWRSQSNLDRHSTNLDRHSTNLDRHSWYFTHICTVDPSVRAHNSTYKMDNYPGFRTLIKYLCIVQLHWPKTQNVDIFTSKSRKNCSDWCTHWVWPNLIVVPTGYDLTWPLYPLGMTRFDRLCVGTGLFSEIWSLFYFLGNKTHFKTKKDRCKHDPDIHKTRQTVQKITETPLPTKSYQHIRPKEKIGRRYPPCDLRD